MTDEFIDRLEALIDEARRKLGVRQARTIKRIFHSKPARRPKIAHTRKMTRALRWKAAYSRHR